MVVGVCFSRLETDVLDVETLDNLMETGSWVTVLRAHDNAYFVPARGLMPTADGSSVQPQNMEGVHMAIEIGLATWPEWGGELRERFSPRSTIPVGFPSGQIEA